MRTSNPVMAVLAMTALLWQEQSPAADAAPSNQQLQHQVQQLQQTVEQLMQRIEALESEKRTVAAAPAPATAPVPATLPTVSPEISPMPVHESFDEDEDTVARIDNELAPEDKSMPGFFPIGGTQTLLRIGGYVKLDAIADSDLAGVRDEFVPSSIPVGAQDGLGRFNMHAKQSRLTLEGRTETPFGPFHFMLQNDFFGPGDSYGYRLRHAWAQLNNTYAGFGWSAFMDLDSGPDTLDFAGPPASQFGRLTSIRQLFHLGQSGSLTLSAEHTDAQITDTLGISARSRTVAPDIVLAARNEYSSGHVQAAAIVRQLAYTSETLRDDTTGAGFALSGSYSPADRHFFVFGLTAGEGIAQHIGDLRGIGMDAVIDSTGALQTPRSIGGWVGYTHDWSGQLRSTLALSELQVDQETWLPPDAFRKSRYGAMNLIWSPGSSWSMGMELLYGSLELQNGEDDDVFRLQGSVKYDFMW